MKPKTLFASLSAAAVSGLLVSLFFYLLTSDHTVGYWLLTGTTVSMVAGVVVWMLGVRRWHTMQWVTDHPSSSPEPVNIWPWQLSQIFVSQTLHNIAAYTLVNPDQARQTIEDLGGLMKMIVEMYRQPFTLLTQEVKCAETFINIEKVRLDRRLQFVKDVSSDCLECRVPSLFLLPLIESSIQYGVETSESVSHVILSARKELGHLVIEISETASVHHDSNLLQKMMQDRRMKQLHRQLLELYYEEQTVEFTLLAPTGTRLSLVLPLK